MGLLASPDVYYPNPLELNKKEANTDGFDIFNAAAWALRKLSPVASFAGGANLATYRESNVNPTTQSTLNSVQESGLARLVDGGFIDNTSVAYALRHLQASEGKSSEPFEITLLMNSSLDPTSGMATLPNGLKIAGSIALLFGRNYSGEPLLGGVGVPNDGFGNALVPPVLSPQVFDISAWNGITAPNWQYSPQEDNSWNMQYYRLNVNTVANQALGIQAGQPGVLNIIATNNGQSGPAPTTPGILDEYDQNFTFARRALISGGGWQALRGVFGFQTPAPVFNPPGLFPAGPREITLAADGSIVDRNRDGIADAEQPHVVGLRLIDEGTMGSDYGAIEVAPGNQISAVTFTSPNADGGLPVVTGEGNVVIANLPSGISNAFAGVVAFTVSGLTPGGSTQTTISFPKGLPASSGNAYVRFNYSTNRFEEYVDAAGNPLYSCLDNDGDGMFDAVNLTLVDGDPSWDGDGVANGTVVDPGFLAFGERNFTGTKRHDIITGNILANTLNGGKGSDWLQGGLGADLLIGGKGRDRYIYTEAAESTPEQRDSVWFSKGDRFVFTALDGDITTDGQQKLTFIGKAAFSGVAGELRATRSVLEADLNGDGLADFAVSLQGLIRPRSSSLLL